MEINGYNNYLIYDNGDILNTKTNKYKKSSTKDNGYKFIQLYKNNKSINLYIHRLVGLHYIDNPENKPQIDHIDRDKSNNDISNLRWVTQTENNYNQKKHKNYINNTTGHKWIYNDYTIAKGIKYPRWIFKIQKQNKTKKKTFKTKIDALCYKFIYIIMNK